MANVRSLTLFIVATLFVPASFVHGDILTWGSVYDSMDAGWSGGVPISGQASWTGHMDSNANPPAGHNPAAGYAVMSPNGRMTYSRLDD